jgi:ABC-type phosphate transport system auxiliary subunit
MDTEAIAHEIVRIRTRLDEMNGEVEGARDGDVDDERAVLEERLRYLQDELAAPSATAQRTTSRAGWSTYRRRDRTGSLCLSAARAGYHAVSRTREAQESWVSG